VLTQNKKAKADMPTAAGVLFDKVTAKMDKDYLAAGSRTEKLRLMQAYQADLRYIERKCRAEADFGIRREIRSMLMGNFRV
jgi:hypothetical protein